MNVNKLKLTKNYLINAYKLIAIVQYAGYTEATRLYVFKIIKVHYHDLYVKPTWANLKLTLVEECVEEIVYINNIIDLYEN